MNLDELLDQTRDVDPLDPTVKAEVHDRLLAAARADIQGRAKASRLQRARPIATGLVAASVAAVAAISFTYAGSGHRAPTAGNGPVDVQFRTVAQVVDATTAAPGPGDPTAARYWKVVTSWKCDGSQATTGGTSARTCKATMYAGNGGPGVTTDASGTTMTVPEATAVVDGKEYAWRQVNTMRLTDAEVRSLVADNGPIGKEARGPSSAYMFKNALGLLVYVPASSAVRKQLWHVLAGIPGVQLDGKATDALGRTGWRLTLDSPGWSTQSILVDPQTGMPLEETDQAPGHEVNVTTVVSVGPADTAPKANSPLQSLTGPHPNGSGSMRPAESGSTGTPPAVVPNH